MSTEEILETHRSSVQERMQDSGAVLALQDPTDLNFTHHRSKDFESGFGLTSSQSYVRGMAQAPVAGTLTVTVINKEAWDTPEAEKNLLNLIPYNRVGEPSDIGKAVVWLASDESEYVHGVTLFVDGGLSRICNGRLDLNISIVRI